VIFVTGASGFIGVHLCQALRQHKFDFIPFGGARQAPVRSSDGLSAQIVDGDTSQLLKLAARYEPKVILHLAALADTAQCERDPVKAQAANSILVAQLINELPTASHIFASTDLVFEAHIAPTGGIQPSARPQARSVYARTKLAGERAVLEVSGPKARNVVARICLTFGARIYDRRCFIHWMIDGLRSGKPLRLFKDEFRTAVFVGDVVAALIELARRRLSSEIDEQKIYHLSGMQRLSRYEFGLQLARKLGVREDLVIAVERSDVLTGVYRAADVSLDGASCWQKLGIVPRKFDNILPAEIF